MAYANIVQVVRRCGGLPLAPSGFTSNTFVTADAVNAWIEEAEIELDAALSAAGGSPPYTTKSAQSILGGWVLDYVLARVYEAHERANGQYASGSVSHQYDYRWDKRLDKIMTQSDLVLALLGSSGSAQFLGHVEDGTKGEKDLSARWGIDQSDTGF